MQIFKIHFNKPQFNCRTDILEMFNLNPILWSSQLLHVFQQRLPPSYHRKSISCKKIPCCLNSTLLPSNNSVRQSFPCYNFEFLYLLILFFYLFIIPYCKVKSTFHSCNYSIFYRIRRKCSMFRNANFYRSRPTIEVLLIYFCQNPHFRSYLALFL